MIEAVADAKVAKNYTARIRAAELIGEEIGMFVERTTEVRSPLDDLTAKQTLALLRTNEAVEAG
ncbi:hypothetical protein [Belnapia rosea]|uniref:Uncharacterized protein n=1 Tax=Belnapia rosea TaxID=938405 RepID=A0A1G7AWR6_9PROT|nr:hypothetical protein [Belnapia rosea]SDE18396.1 hypothetical protein SAMN04487779_102146 [Belnapia rosea]